MERVELRATNRTVLGKKVKRLRAAGWIPAVMFGPDTPSNSIQVEQRDLLRVLHEAGSTALIDLYVDDQATPKAVLAREVQRNPVTGHLLHVDFYQVRLTEKVKTTPRLDFVGKSPLAETGTAVLIHGMNEIEVECLPTDLINSITVDLSVLERMDDNILVSDLIVPPSVTILADPDEVVVSIVPSRMEVVEEEEEEEIELEEVEIAEELVEEAAVEEEATEA
jgi:large subunit ribosomal protein L25